MACVPGEEPVVLARIVTHTSDHNTEIAFSKRRIALDKHYAYWSDYSGRILRTPKAGGATDILLPASSCSIADLAVDDFGVYFGENCEITDGTERFPVQGTLAWLSKDDGTRTDLTARRSADIRQVGLLDGEVYGAFSAEVEPKASLVRVRRNGLASPGSPLSLVNVNAVSLPFAVEPEGVVWFNDGTDTFFRLRNGNDIPEPIARFRDAPEVDDMREVPHVESLFVVEGALNATARVRLESGDTERRLWRAPVSGGPPKQPFDGIVSEFVAADGDGYYGAGVNTKDGIVANRIYRWLPPKYEPEALAAGIDWPKSIAIDSTHVYFVDESMGDPTFALRLVRVAR